MLMPTSPQSVNATATGNGSKPVSGRGLLRRSYADRVCLAADYKTGALKLDPSLKSTCETFRVSPADLRAELEARAAPNGNGGADMDDTRACDLVGMAVELVEDLGLDGAIDLLEQVDS